MIVNLRDYYPFYTKDVFVEVKDEIATQMITWENEESAFRRQLYRYRAQYSLDRNDGIEAAILHKGTEPNGICEEKSSYEQLYQAISRLPEVQAKRITDHFILGISMVDIAHAEGVTRGAVTVSIQRGIRALKKVLEKIFEEC